MEKLTINYIDQLVYNKAKEVAKADESKRQKKINDIVLSKDNALLKFETGTEYATAQGILNKLVTDLEYLENSTAINLDLYAKFMTHA